MRTQRQELEIRQEGKRIVVYTKDELRYKKNRKLVKKWIINTFIFLAFCLGLTILILNILL